jgi:hypothetical protein
MVHMQILVVIVAWSQQMFSYWSHHDDGIFFTDSMFNAPAVHVRNLKTIVLYSRASETPKIIRGRSTFIKINRTAKCFVEIDNILSMQHEQSGLQN